MMYRFEIFAFEKYSDLETQVRSFKATGNDTIQ